MSQLILISNVGYLFKISMRLYLKKSCLFTKGVIVGRNSVIPWERREMKMEHLQPDIIRKGDVQIKLVRYENVNFFSKTICFLLFYHMYDATKCLNVYSQFETQ